MVSKADFVCCLRRLRGGWLVKRKLGDFSGVGLHEELVEAQYVGPDFGLADLDFKLEFLPGVGKSPLIADRMPGRQAFVFVFDFF